MNTKKEIYRILVVEDDPSEQKLIKMMVRQSGYNCEMEFIDDGEAALDYINSQKTGTEATDVFDLIFLDLNLPKVNGIEILKEFRQSECFRKIPVVILTTSSNSSDISLAYESGASGYVRKPAVIEEYRAAVKTVFDYWFGLCLT